MRRGNFYEKIAILSTRIKVVESRSLTEDTLSRLWALFAPEHVLDEQAFRERCRTKCDRSALFYTDHGSAVVGFMGLRHHEVVLASGEVVDTLYFGHGCIAPEFRGKLFIQRTVCREFLRYALKRSGRRLFLWSNALTVRPYLITARGLRHFYPSPFEQTPPDVLEIRDALGRRYYGEHFDPEAGIIQKPQRHVTRASSRIDPARMCDPCVAFYAACNPGHLRGDGLLILQPATWENLAFFLQTRVLGLRPTRELRPR